MDATVKCQRLRLVDSSRYYLFVSASAAGDAVARELRHAFGEDWFDDFVEVTRQSPEEMAEVAIEPSDAAADAILEVVVSGSTSAVLQYSTASEIRAELDRLASYVRR